MKKKRKGRLILHRRIPKYLEGGYQYKTAGPKRGESLQRVMESLFGDVLPSAISAVNPLVGAGVKAAADYAMEGEVDWADIATTGIGGLISKGVNNMGANSSDAPIVGDEGPDPYDAPILGEDQREPRTYTDGTPFSYTERAMRRKDRRQERRIGRGLQAPTLEYGGSLFPKFEFGMEGVSNPENVVEVEGGGNEYKGGEVISWEGAPPKVVGGKGSIKQTAPGSGIIKGPKHGKGNSAGVKIEMGEGEESYVYSNSRDMLVSDDIIASLNYSKMKDI